MLHYQCCLDYPISFAWLGANKPIIKCWNHGTHTLERIKLLFSSDLDVRRSIHKKNHTVIISSDFQQKSHVGVPFPLYRSWPWLYTAELISSHLEAYPTCQQFKIVTVVGVTTSQFHLSENRCKRQRGLTYAVKQQARVLPPVSN